jgi:4-alpha-glucanotransferase
MNSEQALGALAQSYGILPSFHDMSGHEHPTSPETQMALIRANGVPLDNDAMIVEAQAKRAAEEAARKFPQEIVVQSSTETHLDLAAGLPWALVLEGSNGVHCEGQNENGLSLPELPSGLHDLVIHADGQDHHILLIAAPARLPSIVDVTGSDRIWGMNAALYGLRSNNNLGVGDYSDLATVSAAFASVGAGFLGVNPIHALGWADENVISPYSPSHRGFLNPLHIGIGKRVPNNILSEEEQAMAAALRGAETIDYPAHRALKHRILDRSYQAFCGAGAAEQEFDQFCTDQGRDLLRFATYEALSERHGPDWRHWPVDLQCPNTDAVARAQSGLTDRIRFHSWLQWIAHDQLFAAQETGKAAGMSLGLYLDLAVGPRRGGAETWCAQEVVASGVSIGAPPDHLSPAGQNWDLAAFSPEKARRTKYAHFRRTVADTMRHAGVMRIDHILGMNRSFWIPDDGSRGAYIKQPFEALLAIIAIEAERCGTVVIGEDLGLVPDGFRETLAERGLYSYSVLQYEKDYEGRYYSTQHLRPQSLACFSTHDTPTRLVAETGLDRR